MGDGDGDGDQHGFFIPMPDEVRAMLEEQQAQAQMNYADAMHSIFRMLDEGDIEHIKLMRNMLDHIGHNPAALGFWSAKFGTAIAVREKLCQACGRDHDKDLEEMSRASEEAAKQAREDPEERGNRLIAMHEYHVEPVEEDDLWGIVRCTGVVEGNGPCGLTYVNLEDRMVRQPSDCHGCFQKSSQG